MKPIKFKNLIYGAVALGILGVSCENEKTPEALDTNQLQATDLTAVQQMDQTQWATEEVLNLAEEVYQLEALSLEGKSVLNSGFLPDCAIITTEREGNLIEKTIDFGAGCESPNGNLLKGVVVISIERDFREGRRQIDLFLEDFSFNEMDIEGSATQVRMRSGDSANPEAVINSDFTATWPDGEQATWRGERIREWIEGYGSGFWGNHVFLITGSQTFSNRRGITYNRTVLEPLRRELACRFVVSGTLQVSREGWNGVLNFGDGSCDSRGELQLPNGQVKEVTLRRIRP